jgi:hypothetical protein
MSRGKVSGMSTGEVIGLAAAGLAVLYFIMKPSTPATPTIITTSPGAAQAAANASTTNTLYNDSTSVVTDFINAIT